MSWVVQEASLVGIILNDASNEYGLLGVAAEWPIEQTAFIHTFSYIDFRLIEVQNSNMNLKPATDIIAQHRMTPILHMSMSLKTSRFELLTRVWQDRH
jgi:hypothetical protein